ncbi:MAG: hypothetical protein L6Q55_07165 [Azonexus sp.]|nr:hypothetical protein [Azonexus sp.]MCK6412189.1 hypothetical protein [Azonexus sp.]
MEASQGLSKTGFYRIAAPARRRVDSVDHRPTMKVHQKRTFEPGENSFDADGTDFGADADTHPVVASETSG